MNNWKEVSRFLALTFAWAPLPGPQVIILLQEVIVLYFPSKNLPAYILWLSMANHQMIIKYLLYALCFLVM